MGLLRNLRRRWRSRLPILFCIDVEPDAREVDLADPAWHGIEAMLGIVDELRGRLETIAGEDVALNWFVRADPQVERANGSVSWALQRFGPDWERLEAAGDEIGVHTHAWRWDEASGGWICDHGDPAWVEQCVSVSLDAYRSAFGRPTTAYRGGDRFLSDAVVSLLERAGVAIDLTVEPNLDATPGLVETEKATGAIPDYRDAPRRAYRPSLDDFRRPGENGGRTITMLPLSAPLDAPPLYPWTAPQNFEAGLAEVVADPETTHLAFAIRSDAPIQVSWPTCVENLEALARRVATGEARFMAASQAARAL